MRFMVSGGAVWGIRNGETGDEAANLTALDAAFGADMTGPIAMGPEAGPRAEALMRTAAFTPVAALTPDLPVARPGKILCLGHNYVDHIKEGGYDIPEHPAIFVRTLTSLTPAGGAMLRPAASHRFDFEAELMIVIGKRVRGAKAADAMDAVFGYTVFNDGSIRDYQKRSHQWTPGKNFDRTGAVGPYVTTVDELGEAADLHIESRLNGVAMQSATTADMMWKVPQIVEVMSEFATLEPGDLIATGTPPGVGNARTPPVYMKPGDVIECEIEGVGICLNQIEADDAD